MYHIVCYILSVGRYNDAFSYCHHTVSNECLSFNICSSFYILICIILYLSICLFVCFSASVCISISLSHYAIYVLLSHCILFHSLILYIHTRFVSLCFRLIYNIYNHYYCETSVIDIKAHIVSLQYVYTYITVTFTYYLSFAFVCLVSLFTSFYFVVHYLYNTIIIYNTKHDICIILITIINNWYNINIGSLHM